MSKKGILINVDTRHIEYNKSKDNVVYINDFQHRNRIIIYVCKQGEMGHYEACCDIRVHTCVLGIIESIYFLRKVWYYDSGKK